MLKNSRNKINKSHCLSTRKSAQKPEKEVVEKLQTSFASFHGDVDGYISDEMEIDYDNPSISNRQTPLPLGDAISNQSIIIDQNLSNISRRNRSKNIQENASIVSNHENLYIAETQQPTHDNFEFETRDVKSPSIQNEADVGKIVQIYLSTQWQNVLAFKPTYQENFIKWQERIKPFLDDKDDFIFKIYVKQVLQKFDGNVGKRFKFTDVRFFIDLFWS